MSANPYLELVNRRADQPDIKVLFVGPSLAGAAKVFQRENDPVRCEHAETSTIALDILAKRIIREPFDCVMVDMRHEKDGTPLNVVAIAALQAQTRLVVLTNADRVDLFKDIAGVDEVLQAPIEPKAIIRAIMSSKPVEAATQTDPATNVVEITDEIEVDPVQTPVAAHQAALVSAFEAPVEPEAVFEAKPEILVESEVEVAPEKSTEGSLKSKVTKGFETTLSLATEADTQVWQRFVPLANFVYKKLAIIILSALFLAFLTYGAMIVFFMTSSSWSMPFELSRGHTLVEKVERDLSSMRLRQNSIKQDLSQAQINLSNAMREQRDGELNLILAQRTIEEEIRLQKAQSFEIAQHIRRLKRVITDFNKLNGKGGFARNLSSAYARRLITKKSLNSGTLAVLETMHRIASVENEVSLKQLEADRVNRRLEFLESLLEEIKLPELRVVTSAGSDLSHLARDVIETKNRIATATKVVDESQKRFDRFQDSLDVITANIISLEATPAARAMNAPVAVLFVPYTNADNLNPETSLYSCKLSIFWCSEVGVTGAPIEGETVSVHPLFGKPMRGSFVEAEFSDPSSITKELVHAGGSPLLF